METKLLFCNSLFSLRVKKYLIHSWNLQFYEMTIEVGFASWGQNYQ